MGWRVGTKLGRTLYNTRDELVGMMDTPALAAVVVEAVNRPLVEEETAALAAEVLRLRKGVRDALKALDGGGAGVRRILEAVHDPGAAEAPAEAEAPCDTCEPSDACVEICRAVEMAYDPTRLCPGDGSRPCDHGDHGGPAEAGTFSGDTWRCRQCDIAWLLSDAAANAPAPAQKPCRTCTGRTVVRGQPWDCPSCGWHWNGGFDAAKGGNVLNPPPAAPPASPERTPERPRRR